MLPGITTIHENRMYKATVPPVEITGGYCWPTPKYRNWRAQYAFFEGKKLGKIPREKVLLEL
jgi:hypothetical protein